MKVLTGMLALATAMAIGGVCTAHADTAVATKWRAVGESQYDCLIHAAQAIYRSGFDKVPPGSQSASGKKGDYTASIRCIPEQNMVFFVMSGPSADATSRYLDVLYEHY
jgi:hypothetical protein